MNRRAQGTIEYLVVIAVVVVIGLIVIQLSLNLFDSASVSNTSGKIGAKVGSGSISVLEAVVDDDSLLIVLSPLDPKGVELTKVIVDGVENDYNPTLFSSAKGFVLNELSQNCVCSSGQTSRTCSFQFTYITRDGLTQTTDAIDVVVECVPSVQTNNTNYTLTQDTNSPTITLLTPIDDDIVEENEVTFTFQASDDRNISSCTLYIDGEDVNTITNNFSSIKTTISTDGFYDWNISCIDSSSNIGNSVTRDLEIDASDYEINNCLELQGMQNDLSGDYILVSDIDCSDTINWNGGLGFDPVGTYDIPFVGSLEGDNYIISDLTINRISEDYVGLFGHLTSAEISNVGLVSIDLVGRQAVGGIVGYQYGGTISGSYSTGTVVAADDVIGGLVGFQFEGGVISDSYSTCSVTGDGLVAGLVGNQYDGTISGSYATGAVTGNIAVGGLLGATSHGAISDSYSTGGVTGNEGVGGFVGYKYGGTISDSYSTGSVSGSTLVGGFIGDLDDSLSGTIASSYWDTETSGQVASDGGTGKNTSEMQIQSTFTNAGWDFDTIWEIDEGNSYPTLQWQSN